LVLVGPDREDGKHRFGTLVRLRQRIESVSDPQGQLDRGGHGEAYPLARVYAHRGPATRIKAENKRSLVAHDH
jgi:hypothetical protein